ncbi:MAG: NrfD/PsrC family molybdoenzyme membrane anchor subunit [Thiohalomonadales bacterium]
MKKNLNYTEIEGRSFGFYALFGFFGLLTVAGLAATYYMEHNGHWVTGMTNQIVWGTPHVFAVFLIVAASGALNVASVSSVFGKKAYKPLAPLSVVTAIALLSGGLMVLVLDLGRPDRLIVAMTEYNLKSIFAWNQILYNGFFAVTIIYLWFMLEHKMNQYSRYAGFAAFIWRLILTTGTGSIFGFLVARQAYDAAIMAPMFIIMSFSFGLAIFILVTLFAYNGTGREIGDAILTRLRKLLGTFVAAVLFFVITFHLTNLYATEHHGIEGFILLGNNGGELYSQIFWVVQIGLGSLLPLILLLIPMFHKSRSSLILASILIIVGGLAQIYVILIGGQAYPLVLFPGMEVSSSFYDGVTNGYTPSTPEILLGVSGVAVAMILIMVLIKFLKIMPMSLADSVADPHYIAKSDTAA